MKTNPDPNNFTATSPLMGRGGRTEWDSLLQQGRWPLAFVRSWYTVGGWKRVVPFVCLSLAYRGSAKQQPALLPLPPTQPEPLFGKSCLGDGSLTLSYFCNGDLEIVDIDEQCMSECSFAYLVCCFSCLLLWFMKIETSACSDCVSATFCSICFIGFNPVWEETLTFTIHMPEIALVRFLVWDHDPIGRDFVGQRTLAFSSLVPG